MTTMASQITSPMVVYSTVYSDADQRKHQSFASLAFVWGIHRGPVNSPHKWPVTRKIFPFDDVIMPITKQLMGVRPPDLTRKLYGDFGARSRYLSNIYIITYNGILWGVITYPCRRYILVASPHMVVTWCHDRASLMFVAAVAPIWHRSISNHHAGLSVHLRRAPH